MAQNLHLCKMDESVCVSKLWCLHLFGVMASSVFSAWWPNLNTQFYLIEQTFTSHTENKIFLLCLCLRSCGKSLGAGSFILRDGELKSKKHQKEGAQAGMGVFGLRSAELCRYNGIREVFHSHIPVFLCSFLKNNFIKLPIAWYLSEWVCVGFLEGHGVILMQLKNHNMG